MLVGTSVKEQVNISIKDRGNCHAGKNKKEDGIW